MLVIFLHSSKLRPYGNIEMCVILFYYEEILDL